MTRGRARVHLVSEHGPHTARCGWAFVDVTTDASLVTCKACMTALAGKRAARPKRSTADVQAEMAAAFRATLAPTAPAPPRMTAPLWAASCKGGDRRCAECELCAWERDAQLWAYVSPWNKRHALTRDPSAPRWGSLAAALTALVEFERGERKSASALGGILDRLQRGDAGGGGGGGGGAQVDSQLVRRAGELVRVRQALELAYPDGGHELPAQQCRALLLVRTPGIVTAPESMPTYEALAELLVVSAGTLQALVRAGRRAVTEELTARGLIPAQRAASRVAVAATVHYGEAAE